MSIGSRIKARRKELGLTQIELGQRVHKSSQVISNWERGYTTGIAAEDLQHLAKALATDVAFFVPNAYTATSQVLGTDQIQMGKVQETLHDSRLNSLIAEYPRLDEKSKDIIDAIVALSKKEY
ncbi:helix-turn-helix domain-containing protein [Selenomonas ruminantium]|uniref:Transcriptional regulator, contains XRE-family HTH domain n=1 Tax=Selenomonas ruminantium TaxID=971 RepID=A0A1H0VE91_SELRU|nr:helix-turn-helix transcriptional regulator [Selenomonas ruminantium]SDP76694.1 Transcriptional regulator, contains XRE-family HTH domain [Selenomonas ruminantium]